MGRDTGIQWCDDTVNPTSGCDGCELYQPPKESLYTISLPDLKEHLKKQPCYAAQVHENRLAHSFPGNYAMSFSEVRLIPGRLQKCTNWPDLTGKDRPEKPWLNGMPRLIFISDMSDALSEAVPFEYLRDEIILPVIAWQKNRHIGMWLTKRPERMAEFAAWLLGQGITWPSNLWAGTSATTQATLDKRLPSLFSVPASVRFLSAEPLRSPLDVIYPESLFPGGPARCCNGHECGCQGMPIDPPLIYGIDLVICGGESGQKAHHHKMNVAWARSLRDQCKGAGVSFFMKQMGAAPFVWSEAEAAGFSHVFKNQNMDVPPRMEWLLNLKDGHGGDWMEWPEDLRVRQMPKPSEVRA